MEEKIAQTANIVKEAVVIGDVTIGDGSCVLFHAVIRGDDDRIEIGRCTNIQDNCTVHVDRGCPAIIGNYVTVGHNAVLHGCTIGDGSLIGMGSVILNRAKIGKECLIGAGSLVIDIRIGDPGRQSGGRKPGEDKADAYASGEGKTV